MNRGEIRAEIRKLLGNPSTSVVPDADINDTINRQMPKMAAEMEELLTFRDYNTASGETILNQQRYSLPSDFIKLKELWLHVTTTRREKLQYVTHRKFEDLSYGASTQQSEPQFYKIELGSVNNTTSPQVPGDFWVWPIPDVNTYTFRLRYYQAPTDLTADGHIPEFPLFMHMALAYKSAHVIALRQQETQLATLLDQLYRADMRDAKEFYQESQRDTFPSTQDHMGYTETEW